MLSFRRYRSLFSLSSISGGSYYLLSGQRDDSLISTSELKTLILLICGLISLAIQYPISLLKGEVMSSPYEERVYHSKCMILSCRSNGYRRDWFHKSYETGLNINILRHQKEGSQGNVTEANLLKECWNVSLATNDILNWTKLAFLTQYHTLCNDPELMKLQLGTLGRTLVFELLPASVASQPICAYESSHPGHVWFEELLRLAKVILEHDLLKYHHVKSSLYPNDVYEDAFWMKNVQQSYWGNAKLLKRKIASMISTLVKRYAQLDMFSFRHDLKPIEFLNVRMIFVTFLGLMLLLLVESVCEYLPSLLHRLCPG